MKKILCLLLSVLCLFTGGVYARSEITVEIDGVLQEYDVPPQIIKDRTMVPMRKIFEAFGAEVDWDDTLKKVTAVKEGIKVELIIGSVNAKVGEEEKLLDSEPVIIDGRTLVPVRFVSEALGAKVEWDGENKRVIIEKPAKEEENEREEIPYLKVKEVIASSNDGNVPGGAVDGDYETRWSAEGKKQWIRFELEEAAEVGYAGMAFYCGNERFAIFSLEVSEDGDNWEEVYSGKSLMQLDMQPFDMKGEKAKYIRYIGMGSSANLWNSICEVKFYPPREDGSMPVEKAGLDNAASQVKKDREISDELKGVLEQYNDLFTEDTYKWAASMYDPISGGFYFCESSRVNNEFRTTLESTNFIFDFLRFTGIIDNTSWEGSVPEDIRDKLVEYVQSLQDEEDGYFYDVAYGKGVGELKRGRDLTAALKLLQYLGAETLYPTPSERFIDDGEEMSEEGTSGINTESLPEFLQSEEAYREHLENLDMDYDPYYSCSTIGANKSMILALGYGDMTFEFLKETQNPETGLWGADLTNNALNGALKICNWFTSTTEPYPYIEKMIESVMYISENEESDVANCNVWNRVALVQTAVQSYGDNLDEETAKMLDDALVPFLERTLEQTMWYHHDDGGFSIMPGRTVVNYQGAPIGLGGAESDGNAVVITCDIIRDVHRLCGQSWRTDLGKEYKEDFWDWVREAEAIEK